MLSADEEHVHALPQITAQQQQLELEHNELEFVWIHGAGAPRTMSAWAALSAHNEAARDVPHREQAAQCAGITESIYRDYGTL